MLVTIIADASFCPDTFVGGYGYWIASGRGKRGGGGEFKDRVQDSTAAEMYAVVNALHIALREQLVQNCDRLLVQTDCMAAIEAFQGTRKTMRSWEWNAANMLKRLMKTHDLEVEFRHVKGHTNQRGARYVTNHMCDKRAKQSMRRARARALQEN